MHLRFAVIPALAAGLLAQAPHQSGSTRQARDQWQKPQEVVAALELRPDEVIADIGAGAGYFARRFARHAARVYAVDVDTAALARAREGAPANIETIQASDDDPKLPPASVDTIFFCNVLHHIGNRAAYYQKLDRALKPGGRIVILEFYNRKLPVGPREHMKLPEAQVIAELDAAGFKRTRSFDFLPYQYFFVFERK